MSASLADQSPSVGLDQPVPMRDAFASSGRPGGAVRGEFGADPRRSLAVAALGFFVVTLNTLVVGVALPSIGRDLGGGVAGLQWVMDGYALMLAAPLLCAGA